MNTSYSKRHKTGFTLIELLFVILIISILVSLLMPAVSQSRQQAVCVQCESNLRQCGIAMLNYANDQNGWLFPEMRYNAKNVQPFPDTGAPGTIHNVFTVPIFGVWNPPIMICPSDIDPVEQHTYTINSHIMYWKLKYGSRLPEGGSPSDVVLMGEKTTRRTDYYMDYKEYPVVVEKYRHGFKRGSNYLMLDLHVETALPFPLRRGSDPWDFAIVQPPEI